MKIELSRRLRQLEPAFGRSERLEQRLAFSASPTADSDDTDQTNGFPHAPRSSCSCPGCSFVVPSEIQVAPTAAQAQFPLSDTFKLHSRPTATKRIYLDFDGQVTKDPSWNGGAEIVTPAYSLDDDFSTFTDAEKTAIQEVWSRVAEDFAPFDVNVCTEEPTLDDLRNTGGTDDRWGIREIGRAHV